MEGKTTNETSTTIYTTNSEIVTVESEIVQIKTRLSTTPNRKSDDKKNADEVRLRTIQNIYTEKDDSVASSPTRRLNKSAYLKLHRSSFHRPKSTSVDALKEKYEGNHQTEPEPTNTVTVNKDKDIAKRESYNETTVIKEQTTVSEVLSHTDNPAQDKLDKTNDYLCLEAAGDLKQEKTIDKGEKRKEIKTAEKVDPILKTTSKIENLQSQLSTKLPQKTVESLRSKYSPASFGYPSLVSAEKAPKKVTFSPSVPPEKPVPPPRPKLLSPPPQKVTVKFVALERSVSESNDSTPEEELGREDDVNNNKKELTPEEKPKPIPAPRSTLKEKDGQPKKEDKVVSTEEVETGTSPTATSPKEQPLISNLETQTDPKQEPVQILHTNPTYPKEKPALPRKPSLRRSEEFRQSRLESGRPKSTLLTKKPKPDPRRPLSSIESKYLLPTILSEEDIEYNNIQFGKPEGIHLIVRRSSSEDSEEEVNKYKTFFDGIDVSDMEGKKKEKKRSNSFKKILPSFFTRDKKNKDDDDKKDKKSKKEDNRIFADNVQNETNFNKKTASKQGLMDNKQEVLKSGPSGSSRKQQDNFARYEEPPRANDVKRNDLDRRQNEPISPIEKKVPSKDIEAQFAEMHINRYNQIRDNFAQMHNQRYEGYVDMDNGNSNRVKENFTNINSINKFIDTSSSSNTLSSENRSDTYENALVAAELLQRKEDSRYQNKANARNRYYNEYPPSPETFSATPPRAQDTCQNVQLIKPKALIPINSERPLPNPYHNGQIINQETYETVVESKTLDRNLNVNDKKQFPTKGNIPENKSTNKPSGEGVYGTVFDPKSVSAQVVISRSFPGMQVNAKDVKIEPIDKPQMSPASPKSATSLSPRTPSLETSKLKLPPNREKVELQPRIKSPIPQTKVSTDKIIATELLKNKSDGGKKENDKRTSPSHQRLEIEIDYPQEQTKTYGQNSLSPREKATVKSDHSTSSLRSDKSQKDLSGTLGRFDGRGDSPSRVRTPTDNLGNVSRRSSSSFTNSPSSRHSTALPARMESPGRGAKSPDRASLPTTLSPRPASAGNMDVAQHLEAAVWQRKQRELAASPSFITMDMQKEPAEIQTQNSPRNPMGARTSTPVTLQGRPQVLYSYKPQYQSQHQPQHQSQHQFQYPPQHQPQLIAQQHQIQPLQDIRASTPINTPQNLQVHSPSKAEMRQQVEAFCWKELKKLKDKEDQEIYQMQLSNLGYAEDPVVSRRCRSVSPSTARGRRSLSLPRDPRMTMVSDHSRARPQQPIPEHRVVQIDPNYGYVTAPVAEQYFVRNSPQRRTIDTTYTSRKPVGNIEEGRRPIFQRGSLTPNPQLLQEHQMNYNNKKVSFPHPGNQQNAHVWPTKNGYTQSPPTRRLEKRDSFLEDDVFLPETPRGTIPGNQKQVPEDLYASRQRSAMAARNIQQVEAHQKAAMLEDPYATRKQILQEDPYGTRIAANHRRAPQEEPPYVTRRQLVQEDPYASRKQMIQEDPYASRKQMVQEDLYVSRRQVLQEDPYVSRRQLLQEDPYVSKRQIMQEVVYGRRTPSVVASRPPQARREREEAQEELYGSRQAQRLMERPNSKQMEGAKQDGRKDPSDPGRRNETHDRNIQIREELLAKEPKQREVVSASRSAKDLYEQRVGAQDSRSKERLPSEVYVSREQVVAESPYGSRQSMGRVVPQNTAHIMRESPYGSRQSFNTGLYDSRQSVVDPIYGSKQVTVSNKVCDIYGKIHDTNQRQMAGSGVYGQVQETGVIYGQLRRNPKSPPQSYQQLAPNFVRGSRLTSSANDMYRRNPRMEYHMDLDGAKKLTVRPFDDSFDPSQAPNRPLPPVPGDTKTKFLLTRRENSRRYPAVYDPESGSDTSEVQRIMQNGTKGRAPNALGK